MPATHGNIPKAEIQDPVTPTVVLGPCAGQDDEATWLRPLATKLMREGLPVVALISHQTGRANRWEATVSDTRGLTHSHELIAQSLAEICRGAAQIAPTEYLAFHNNGSDLDADILRHAARLLEQLNHLTVMRYRASPSDLLFAGILVAKQSLLDADWAALGAPPHTADRFARGVMSQLRPPVSSLIGRTGVKHDSKGQLTNSYLVLGTPRTGSTLLCDALSRVGYAGRPREYLLPGIAAEYYLISGARNPADYFSHIHTHESEDGTFGAKVHWPHLVSLQEELERGHSFPFSMAHVPASDFHVDQEVAHRLEQTLDALAPNASLILTVRADKQAQAVSGFMAQQREEWFTFVKGDEPPIAYDPDVIRRLEDRYVAWDTQIHDFLHQLRRPFLTVEYESLVSQYRETVTRALNYIGIQVQKVPQPRLVRQMPTTKAKILERYRADRN